MATATLMVSRTWGGLIDRGRPWEILIDGKVAGSIGIRQSVELPVEPGQHTLRVMSTERFGSVQRSFDAQEGQAVRFSCHGPRWWPILLASLAKPDLWITLKPVSS